MAAAISATNGVSRADAADALQRSTRVDPSFARALNGVRTETGVTVVAAVRTRIDANQASAALRSAYEAVTGEPASEGTVRVLTAQWAHETGNGASMFNYNFGGIKGAGPSGLSVSQRTREGFGANERSIVDNFRAYRTAEEGATDYVRLLQARFPEALKAAQAGDPAGFVHALKARGYFTGDEAAYTRSVVALSGMPYAPSAAAPLPELSPSAIPESLALGRMPASVAMVASGNAGALIDGLALADEISRAALRIAAATRPESERG